MDKQQNLKMIEELSNASGPAGFEHEVVATVKKYLPTKTTAKTDAMCNTFIRYQNEQASKPTLMLDAHLDEVGFIVQAVKPNGTIKFVPLGNWVPANVTAEKVRIKNRRGKWITGVVATKPPHFMNAAERKQPVEIENLVIDVGTINAQETKEKLQINTGCPIVPDVSWQYFADRDFMLGKAFDNRIGTAVILSVLNELQDKNLGVNLVGALAAQEEVGCRGAKVTIRQVKPQIAICIEGCPADDTFTPEWLIQTGFKRGPMLRDLDTTFIATPKFQEFAVKQAETNQIPYTRAVRTGGGIDGSQLLYYEGIPTICIGIPVRYEHTHYSLVAYQDFAATVKLLEQIILKLDRSTIATF
jgi:putative aminopeptidase FrvX